MQKQMSKAAIYKNLRICISPMLGFTVKFGEEELVYVFHKP